MNTRHKPCRRTNKERFDPRLSSPVTPGEINDWLSTPAENDNDNMLAAKEAFARLPETARRLLVMYIHNPNTSLLARETGIDRRKLSRYITDALSIFKNVRDDMPSYVLIRYKKPKQCH